MKKLIVARIVPVLGIALACSVHAATPDIRANGAGGGVKAPQDRNLSVTVQLDADGNTAAADWWLLAHSPSGWYYYNLPKASWYPGFKVTYQGRLFDLTPCEVLNISGLPIGSYNMYFGVDFKANGSLDPNLSYDSISIEVVDYNTLSKLYVDAYDSAKAYNGTTLFSDLHNQQMPRIVEVDMSGNIVWQYLIPEELRQYTGPGLDVERLSNNNILFVLPLKGVFEINRDGTTVWSYLTEKISHDADRLPSGNTIFVFGGDDQVDDAQVNEIDPDGNIVWSWYARDELYVDPYKDIYDEGWTHTNAVTRMEDGNTLINLRNFNLTVIVNPQGTIVRRYSWTPIDVASIDPHDPEVLADGNLLIALHNPSPYQAVEIDMETQDLVWTYSRSGLHTTRDADRLPNGNTLLVGILKDTDDAVIFEVTGDGEIVWQLKIKNAPPGGRWFYKAERISG